MTQLSLKKEGDNPWSTVSREGSVTEGKERQVRVTRSPTAIHTVPETLGETLLPSGPQFSHLYHQRGWVFNPIVLAEPGLLMTSFSKATL